MDKQLKFYKKHFSSLPIIHPRQCMTNNLGYIFPTLFYILKKNAIKHSKHKLQTYYSSIIINKPTSTTGRREIISNAAAVEIFPNYCAYLSL